MTCENPNCIACTAAKVQDVIEAAASARYPDTPGMEMIVLIESLSVIAAINDISLTTLIGLLVVQYPMMKDGIEQAGITPGKEAPVKPAAGVH